MTGLCERTSVPAQNPVALCQNPVALYRRAIILCQRAVGNLLKMSRLRKNALFDVGNGFREGKTEFKPLRGAGMMRLEVCQPSGRFPAANRRGGACSARFARHSSPTGGTVHIPAK